MNKYSEPQPLHLAIVLSSCGTWRMVALLHRLGLVCRHVRTGQVCGLVVTSNYMFVGLVILIYQTVMFRLTVGSYWVKQWFKSTDKLYEHLTFSSKSFTASNVTLQIEAILIRAGSTAIGMYLSKLINFISLSSFGFPEWTPPIICAAEQIISFTVYFSLSNVTQTIARNSSSLTLNVSLVLMLYGDKSIQ